MARTTRTTKRLAQRIDLGYLRRPHPFRTWKFWLSVGVPAVALVWLLANAMFGNDEVYRGGTTSLAHSVFANECRVCHVEREGRFREPAEDAACLTCHDGAIHHADQKFMPACGSCHVEHMGRVRLRSVADSDCAQCHANLAVKTGAPQFVTRIRDFGGHPEFAALRLRQPDPGKIKLNHFVHLKKDLEGPKSKVQMECFDCHRLALKGNEWRYAAADFVAEDTRRKERRMSPGLPPGSRAYMLPPTYARTCAACHPLRFDARFLENVPHDSPKAVRQFLLAKYRDYIRSHPQEVNRVETVERRLPGEPAFTKRAHRADEWVAQRMEEAETLLGRKTCLECHFLTAASDGLVEVAAPRITPVWMPHANFSHTSHGLLKCASCHTQTANSKETSDVLLPAISTCQKCHRGGETADNRCSYCHSYHDATQRKEVRGGYSIEQLLHGR